MQIDNNMVSIQRENGNVGTGGMEGALRGCEFTLYQHSFALSSELDGSKTNASLKDDGVGFYAFPSVRSIRHARLKCAPSRKF